MDIATPAPDTASGRQQPRNETELGFHLRDAPEVLLRILRYAFVYRGRLTLALAASLAASFFNLAIPRLLGLAVDITHRLAQTHGAHTNPAFRQLFWAASLLVIAAILRGLLQMTAGFQSEYIGQSMGRDLRLLFFEKLQRLGFDFHDAVHSGDLITRGMLDLEGVRGFIENGLQRLVSLLFILVVGFAVLFAQDPLMAALTLSFVPLVGWRAARMGLALRIAWTQLQERMSALTRIMEENLQGVRVVRAYAAQNFELEKFDLVDEEAFALANKRISIRSRAMTAINSGYYIAMALVLWVGGWRVTRGAITIGQLTEFLSFLMLLQMPLRHIGMISNSSARAISSGKRFFEILDLDPTITERHEARPLQLTKGELRFNHVSFRYAREANAPLALDDVSFSVSGGKTLGIVGPSGAGKSTIALLCSRFYDVTSGSITIDGQDIRDATLASVRGAVGVVQQDVFLFDESVANNVGYADPDSEEHEIVDAALTAQIHDHVVSLPQAYGTKIGERGVSLSGGQRQRLSIARSLVGEPSIVIFDDATSAVDAATEYRVRHALRSATEDWATIIISHRIGSLMHADEIIVLQNGKITERGTHAALLAHNGYYAMLYHTQSAPPETSPADTQEAASYEFD